MDEIVESENLDVTTVVTPSNDKTVENKGVSNTVESNAVRMNNTSAPIIEDWNSDDESEIDYTVEPSTEKIKSVKTVREIDAHKQYPRRNQRNWNNLMSQRLGSDFKMTNKACYVCGSFEHLHYVCDKKIERPVWNNSRRVNHKNFTNKMTHPHPKRSFVPQAVLTRSGKLSTAGVAVNTVRPVNTANTKAVNTVRPVNTANTKAVNTVRPVNTANTKAVNTVRSVNTAASKLINSIINTNVNTARVKHTTARDRAVVSENKGKRDNAIKASSCWVWKAKTRRQPTTEGVQKKGVIDSGCSRHMTGNKCYLDKYEDYYGGFVSFGDGKGRISGKGKIKTGSLDFDDVYFCKELKYNLFSMSQICDKKNNGLFTDTSVDLKSVVPTRGLTCLIAKATIDESNTWHMRLGHINFKTMNKLVKGNLVKVYYLEVSTGSAKAQQVQKPILICASFIVDVALLERRLMNPLIKTDLSLPSCKRDLELSSVPFNFHLPFGFPWGENREDDEYYKELSEIARLALVDENWLRLWSFGASALYSFDSRVRVCSLLTVFLYKRICVFTWEREDQFEKKYPHLFAKTAPSSSAAS
ncbi:ribonuclease H-like domain-containing protein [Tanacetum coccineum]